MTTEIAEQMEAYGTMANVYLYSGNFRRFVLKIDEFQKRVFRHI